MADPPPPFNPPDFRNGEPVSPRPTKIATEALQATAELRDEVAGLAFADPVAWVYNPLEYAWDLHAQYVTRWGRSRRRVLMLGMNPGPWGMAQTGVPFGEIGMVLASLLLGGGGLIRNMLVGIVGSFIGGALVLAVVLMGLLVLGVLGPPSSARAALPPPEPGTGGLTWPAAGPVHRQPSEAGWSSCGTGAATGVCTAARMAAKPGRKCSTRTMAREPSIS